MEKAFRDMVRQDRAMTIDETMQLIAKENYGVLSVIGDDGYPYGVPINYAYRNGKFYMHSTNRKSHKIDAIRQDDKVCLTIIGRHDLMAEEYTTLFSSAVIFGRAVIPESPEEKMKAMILMMEGLAPEALDRVRDACVKHPEAYAMILIEPDHITGKIKREI